MTPSLATLHIPALPGLLPAAVSLLAALLGFAACQRLRSTQGADRSAWLMVAAMALAGGLWSAPVLVLADLLAPLGGGFHPGIVIAAAVGALVLIWAAITWTLTGQPGWPQVLAGAAALATAALATQMLLLGSVGLHARIGWRPGWLAAAWSIAAGGYAAAWIALLNARPAVKLLPPRHLWGAAALAMLAVTGSQMLTLRAANLPANEAHVDRWLVDAATVRMAVAGGTGVLLAALAAALTADAWLRRRRDAAARDNEVGALRDRVTRLPTRSVFEGTLTQALRAVDARRGRAALLHIALDGVGTVAERHGAEAGHAVLRQIAERLRSLAEPHRLACVSRDEFLLLLDSEDAPARARALAAQLLESLMQPCAVGRGSHELSCSIGLAMYPQHGALPALIEHAAIAARASKSAGGATYSFFDARMVDEPREQAELLRDLRNAMARGQLALFYQPKIHAPSGEVTAAEALLRWNHPQRGLISPSVFIPLAERSGLIDMLGAWVIEEACRQVRQWREQGLRMRVAVNLSAHQLRQPDIAAQLRDALSRHRIDADLLTCEITESMAMEDTQATLRAFTELTAIGVSISLDDFGAGYSSLAYLRKLPATELKIDRGFVLDLEHSAEAREIAETVVKLARTLGMSVVAEGVETDAQYRILREMGCNQVQGFLFARPMAADALAQWAHADEAHRRIQFRESLFRVPTVVPTAALA
jgi:diguanylate cyclase (GGDEF)-like protein